MFYRPSQPSDATPFDGREKQRCSRQRSPRRAKSIRTAREHGSGRSPRADIATRFTYGKEGSAIYSRLEFIFEANESTVPLAKTRRILFAAASANAFYRAYEAHDPPVGVGTNTNGRNQHGYEDTRVGMSGTRTISEEFLVAAAPEDKTRPGAVHKFLGARVEKIIVRTRDTRRSRRRIRGGNERRTDGCDPEKGTLKK